MDLPLNTTIGGKRVFNSGNHDSYGNPHSQYSNKLYNVDFSVSLDSNRYRKVFDLDLTNYGHKILPYIKARFLIYCIGSNSDNTDGVLNLNLSLNESDEVVSNFWFDSSPDNISPYSRFLLCVKRNITEYGITGLKVSVYMRSTGSYKNYRICCNYLDYNSSKYTDENMLVFTGNSIEVSDFIMKSDISSLYDLCIEESLANSVILAEGEPVKSSYTCNKLWVNKLTGDIFLIKKISGGYTTVKLG